MRALAWVLLVAVLMVLVVLVLCLAAAFRGSWAWISTGDFGWCTGFRPVPWVSCAPPWDPEGVAVNEATGDVYVVDQGNERVEEFQRHDRVFVRAWGWGVDR
jgi:hypothetical protein